MNEETNLGIVAPGPYGGLSDMSVKEMIASHLEHRPDCSSTHQTRERDNQRVYSGSADLISVDAVRNSGKILEISVIKHCFDEHAFAADIDVKFAKANRCRFVEGRRGGRHQV